MKWNKTLLDLGGALFVRFPGKNKYKGFHPPESPGAIEVAQDELTIQNTVPVEEEITIGRFLSTNEIRLSRTARELVLQARSILEPSFKGSSKRFTIHLSNKWHIDIRVYRPYFLRKDKHGAIREVHPKIE